MLFRSFMPIYFDQDYNYHYRQFAIAQDNSNSAVASDEIETDAEEGDSSALEWLTAKGKIACKPLGRNPAPEKVKGVKKPKSCFAFPTVKCEDRWDK